MERGAGRGAVLAAAWLVAAAVAGGPAGARAQAVTAVGAPARVLGPTAADEVRRSFAAAAPTVRLREASLGPGAVRATACAGADDGGPCWTVVMTDPAGTCGGTVAGPWCVALEGEVPAGARAALLAALGRPDARTPWAVPARAEGQSGGAEGAVAGGDRTADAEAGGPGEGPAAVDGRAVVPAPPYRAWRPRDAGSSVTDLAWNVALPVLLWGLLAAVALGWARGAARCPPSGGWRRRDAWALAGLALLAVGLRLALAHEGPINFVEADRLPLVLRHGGYAVAAALGVPLALVLGDPVAGAAWTNLAFSSAAPVVAAVAGTLWWGRTAGAVAGLLLAAAPGAIRWSRTTDAAVPAALLALLAAAALEVARRRGDKRAWAVAGGAWALAAGVRPEGPALVVALAAWLAVDRPLRRALARPGPAVLLGLPLLSAVAARVALTAGGGQPVGLDPGPAADLVGKWAAHLGSLLNPAAQDPVPVVLALAGALLAGGGARAFAVVAALLPSLLPALAGIGDAADHNTRYALVSLPFVCLLAGAAVQRGAGVLAGRLPRKVAGAAGPVLAAAVATAVVLRGLAAEAWLPAPLQAQGDFLAAAAPGLPDGSVLWTASDPSDPGTPAVVLALARAGRWSGSADPAGCRGRRGVTVADLSTGRPSALAEGPAAGCPALHLRGAWSRASDAAAAADRALQASGPVAEPVRVRTVPVRDPGDGRPSTMDLGLWRLRPAGEAPRGPPDPG